MGKAWTGETRETKTRYYNLHISDVLDMPNISMTAWPKEGAESGVFELRPNKPKASSDK